MSILEIDDVLRVNRFFRYINRHYDDFINSALGALNTLFGYRLTSYVVFDIKSDGSHYVSDIGSTSLNHEVLEKYKDYYYKVDVFWQEFKKKSHSSKNNYFFTITDFMTQDEFCKTEHGKFLSDYNLNYYASITTGAVSNFPVYSLNVHRTNEEGDFSPKDLALLELIGKAFIESYFLYIQHITLSNAVSLIRQFTDTFDYGFAIIDENRNIISNNSTYIFYASRITNKKDIFSINEDLLEMLETRLGCSLLYIKKDIILNFDTYKVKLMPNSAITEKNISRHLYISIFDNFTADLNASSNLRDLYSQNTVNINDKGKFTNREYEIIELMLQGCNNQEIANKLYISIFTVKTHIKNIFNKLDVSTRMAAIAKLSDLK